MIEAKKAGEWFDTAFQQVRVTRAGNDRTCLVEVQPTTYGRGRGDNAEAYAKFQADCLHEAVLPPNEVPTVVEWEEHGKPQTFEGWED